MALPTEAIPVASAVAWLPDSAIASWGVMAALLLLSLIVTRRLRDSVPGPLQNFFEMFTESLVNLIREIVRADPKPYVPLMGTLFLFVFVSNLVGMVPGLHSPTSDLSVTAALAVIVLFSVPFYGMWKRGARAYLKSYLQPNPFMLPFNLLGEITRTLSLAVRLFGNIMSGEFLMAVVVGVVSNLLLLRISYHSVFAVPTVLLVLFLSILSLITAAIQAYIFTVLALVYIGAVVEQRPRREETQSTPAKEGATS